jgi:membrane protease YdiL (CAAX protease family)
MQSDEPSMRQSKIRLRIFNNFLVRLALLAIVTFLLMIALQVGTHVLAAAVPVSWKLSVFVALELLACVLMIVAYRVGVRLLEQRAAAEIAFAGKAWLFLPGAFLGLAIFVVVFAILWAAGIAQYEGPGQIGSVIRGCAAALAAAVGEEIVFRGAVFRPIDERFGTTAALVFSAALFGLLHMANPGATVLSTTAIALESGVLLGAAFANARSLWLPIGIHFGWNFTEGSIFGTAVSGGKSAGLFNFSLNGPDFFTGGAFGPEASAIAVGACLAASAIFIWSAIRHGRWRPFQLRSIKTQSIQ